MPRSSFGGFYGALKGDASDYCVNFFQEQFIQFIDYISPYECLEIIEALNANSTLEKQKKHQIIENYLTKIILEDFKKTIRYRASHLLRLY